MKHAKYFQLVLVIFLLIISFSTNVAAQSASKSDSLKSDFKNMVDSQRFVFEAQSVNPLRGNFRNLTSPYDVSVTKDTLRSYLPYFGRAHNPSYGTNQSAFDFTSTNFSYSVTPNKKGGWNIAIKPKDKTDIQEYLFTVFDNGNASLNVTSTSRDAISFNGYVRAKK